MESPIPAIGLSSGGFPSAHAQGAATVWGYLAARPGRWFWIAGFLLGAAVLFALYLGLKLAFPGENRVGRTVATALSAVRYCLAASWVFFAGRLLFVKTRLAARETQ